MPDADALKKPDGLTATGVPKLRLPAASAAALKRMQRSDFGAAHAAHVAKHGEPTRPAAYSHAKCN